MPEQRKFDPYSDVLVNLPVEAQRLLLTILTRHDPMEPSTSRKVKNVCARYKTDLLLFGLLPDYYAYALIYWASVQSKEALRSVLQKVGHGPPAARDLFGPHSLN
jgi:hypothetical protein